MPNYAASIAYILFAWAVGLSYSDMWNVIVKCGAVVTFVLASSHMALKIVGQLRDNKLKKLQLERAE